VYSLENHFEGGLECQTEHSFFVGLSERIFLIAPLLRLQKLSKSGRKLLAGITFGNFLDRITLGNLLAGITLGN
jgi:hypothetical protein